tara:strand:- start:361 stop:486 length:126 start_codon:yes stop_codon:yes gene_type:complete
MFKYLLNGLLFGGLSSKKNIMQSIDKTSKIKSNKNYKIIRN